MTDLLALDTIVKNIANTLNIESIIALVLIGCLLGSLWLTFCHCAVSRQQHDESLVGRV